MYNTSIHLYIYIYYNDNNNNNTSILIYVCRAPHPLRKPGVRTPGQPAKTAAVAYYIWKVNMDKININFLRSIVRDFL